MTIKKIVFPICFIAFSHKDFSVEKRRIEIWVYNTHNIVLFGIFIVNML